jgi:hypothetical protein
MTYKEKLIEVALPLEDTCLRTARRQVNRDLPAPRLRQAGAANGQQKDKAL